MQDFVPCKVSVFAAAKPKLFLLKQEIRKIALVMKITAILLLAAALQVSAAGWGQERINLSFNNAPLEQVLKSITAQTGVAFLYRPQYVKDKKVTIQITNATLKMVLDISLKDQQLTYEFIEKNVAIRPIKKDKENIQSNNEHPPLIDVRGRVVNEKGEPVEGVTVTVKGTDKKAITDKDGEFSLSTVDQNATLVFTHVSLETFEVNVRGKQNLALSLKTKVSALGDVTVTVNTGYQQLPRERATGSFGFINNEQLNRKVGTDILSRLEGVTTGVSFDRRRLDPNQAVVSPNNIMIRGVSTLTEEMRTPLIIVDNFPYDGDINNINPNDVENITILKDAAAASIWGARAGNGVIVITTKRGGYNKPFSLSLNANVQITSKPDLFKYPAMSSDDFIDLEIFLFDKAYFNGILNNPTRLPVSPVIEILANKRAGLITEQEATAQINVLRNFDVRNDFEKYIYRTGVNNQYALNLSGGSQKLGYSISGGLDKSNQVLKGDDFRRITFRSAVNMVPIKNLEINAGIAYSNSTTKNNSLGNIGGAAYKSRNRALYPYARFADEDGNALPVVKDFRLAFIDTAGAGKLLDWFYRPLEELRNANNKSNLSDMLFTFGISYRVSNAITLRANYQYENSATESRRLYSKETYLARDLINRFTQISSGGITYNVPPNGIMDLDNSKLNSHVGRLQIDVGKKWGNSHEINGIIGGEIRDKRTGMSYQRFYGFDANRYTSGSVDYLTNFAQYGTPVRARITDRAAILLLNDRFVSMYGNFAYTYKSRYTLSTSARRDAANVFGIKSNNKWKPLWTAGAAWAVHQESFYHSRLFPYLRLRATYGYQGNVNNSLTPNTIIRYNATNNIANLPWAYITDPANPQLAWESTGQLNLGLDFKVNERVQGSVEVYRKKSVNLLWNMPIDPSTGIIEVKSNSATMVGRGIELAMQTINIKGAFKWNSEFGFSYNTNKVIDYVSLTNNSIPASRFAETSGLNIIGLRGKSPYSLFSYPFAGLDPANGDPLGYLGKNTSKDYQAIFNQLLDTSNIIYHGSAIPTYTGFFNQVMSYKGFKLIININYRLGYYFRKSTISYFDLIGSGTQHADYAKRWQAPGDENITTVPSFVYPAGSGERDRFYAASSANVYKGDHIRLQNIRLSYDVTGRKNRSSIFRSAQIYGNIENVGMIWRVNDAGLDPDYNIGNAIFPVPRIITAGLQLSF